MTSFKIFGDKISGPSTCSAFASVTGRVRTHPVSSIPGFCGGFKCTYMTRIKLLFVLEMFKETNYLVNPYCDPTSSKKALLFNFCLGNKNTRNCTRICTDAFGWSYCHVYFQSVNVVSMSGDLLPLNDLELHPPILHVFKTHTSPPVFWANSSKHSTWPNEVVKASRRKNRIWDTAVYSQKVGDESIPLKPDTKVSW